MKLSLLLARRLSGACPRALAFFYTRGKEGGGGGGGGDKTGHPGNLTVDWLTLSFSR